MRMALNDDLLPTLMIGLIAETKSSHDRPVPLIWRPENIICNMASGSLTGRSWDDLVSAIPIIIVGRMSLFRAYVIVITIIVLKLAHELNVPWCVFHYYQYYKGVRYFLWTYFPTMPLNRPTWKWLSVYLVVKIINILYNIIANISSYLFQPRDTHVLLVAANRVLGQQFPIRLGGSLGSRWQTVLCQVSRALM